MEESGDESLKSGSEDEPLVPDIIDEDFFTSLSAKVPEIGKILRQKDNQETADNFQRIFLCCCKFKDNFEKEKLHSEEIQKEADEAKLKVERAEEISRLDQGTILELRKVIERAWREKDVAQLREQTAKEELVKLQEKIGGLEVELQILKEKKIGRTEKRDDAKEQDKLKSEIVDLIKKMQIQKLHAIEVENTTKTLEEKNKGLSKALEETTSDLYNSKKQLEALTKELSALKSEEGKLQELVEQFQLKNEKLTKQRIQQNLQILTVKTNLQQLQTQHNAINNKLAKVIVDLEYSNAEKDKYRTDLIQRANLLKVREDELIKLKKEIATNAKFQEAAARKHSNLIETQKKTAEENLRMKSIINTQEKELHGLRKIVERFEANNETLTKERDALKRSLITCQQEHDQIEQQFQESQYEIRSLHDSIALLELQQKKRREEISKLKHEKNKKLEEIQTLGDKIDALQNEIHLKENYEIELKRTVSDIEGKCAELQTQYDALQSDKSNLQRTIQSHEEEQKNLKKQLETASSDIKNLRSNICLKDGDISKLQLQIDKLEKERRMFKVEIRNTQLAHQHTRSELQEKRLENDRHSKSLQEDEHKLSRQKKELDNVIQEKNSISSQLTKRNEEFAQLKDSMDNLQSVYNQTEKLFGTCQEDMRLMKIEIQNLRTERDVLRRDREAAADLRKELLQMHRDLNQQRIKARALQDEMMRPMNIHRWRNLPGSDPEKMELIERIQTLKRLLLSQNVDIFQQSQALEESKALYEALKEFVQKLPSYKVKEELNEVKHSLFVKNRKLKSVIAELNCCEADGKAKQIQVEDLKATLTLTKVELCAEKKKKQRLVEERQILSEMQFHCLSAPPMTQRTLGAGYKL